MTVRFPSFGGLKAFYALVETERVKDAAEMLGVSASAVSHQIKKLEQELNVRLIESQGGRLRPTTAGARYFQGIQSGLKAILNATEELRMEPGRQRVTMTLTPSFAAIWLLPRMKDLCSKHPEIDLNLVATTRVCDLAREHIDIAIRRGRGEWEGMISNHLLHEQLVPVIGRDLASSLRGRSVAEVLRSTRVLVNVAMPREWDEWCHVRGIDAPAAKNRFQLESYELTIQAARDGLGVALGRKPLVDEMLADGELTCVCSDGYRDSMGYYVVWSKSTELTGPAKKVLSWLLPQANRTN